jgi:hypothetical protein
MNEPDCGLHSLHAIHFATASIVAPELEGLSPYDA